MVMAMMMLLLLMMMVMMIGDDDDDDDGDDSSDGDDGDDDGFLCRNHAFRHMGWRINNLVLLLLLNTIIWKATYFNRKEQRNPSQRGQRKGKRSPTRWKWMWPQQMCPKPSTNCVGFNTGSNWNY